MGFFRAGTEAARSALHFPDARLFAIASSLHLNSFDVLRGSILQLTFHVSFVVWSGLEIGTATYVELPRCRMQLATTCLEKRRSFHGHLQSKYSHSRRLPQRLLVKIVTRDVTRCLDDTHICQTSDRIKAPWNVFCDLGMHCSTDPAKEDRRYERNT